MAGTYPTTDVGGNRIQNPSMPIASSIKANTLSIKFASQHEQRRRNGVPLETWSIDYKLVHADVYATLRAFYFDKLDIESFTWRHPTLNTVYKVRFDDSAFASSYVRTTMNGHYYKISFRLTQVI